ncbi:uncharacterized protein LOC131685395 [Topomyia yanbarensis]|uniref:uncharacterized protein LOC131685395 n=1 Tax=Topomyia yanbarensis TaxID=2498891 RepID=UPI00273B393E|nr:uncharacterized protein LOC131685395 [Topomyia yanbarensis]
MTESDCEPDFTDPEGKLISTTENEATDEQIDSETYHRLPSYRRNYTEADLYPTEKDPRCDPECSLSYYWPVYVSNLRVLAINATFKEVSEYFAYKGLLVKAVLLRGMTDELYRECQYEYKIVDLLVYFTSKKDAEDAIRYCNRETYYGSRLNVLSGRDPDYFDNERSFRIKQLSSSSLYKTEDFYERPLSRYGKVELLIRHTPTEFVVQFVSKADMISSLCQMNKFVMTPLTGPTRKQRYLEEDVKTLLHKRIRFENFLEMRPEEHIMQALREGKQPQVSLRWQKYLKPLMSRRQVKKLATSKKYLERVKMIRNERKLLGQNTQYTPTESTRTKLLEIEENAQNFLQKMGVNPADRIPCHILARVDK